MPRDQPLRRDWRQIELEFKARVPIQSIVRRHSLTVEKLYRRARQHGWPAERLTKGDMASINQLAQEHQIGSPPSGRWRCSEPSRPGRHISTEEARAYRIALQQVVIQDQRNFVAAVRAITMKVLGRIEGGLGTTSVGEIVTLVGAIERLHTIERAVYS